MEKERYDEIIKDMTTLDEMQFLSFIKEITEEENNIIIEIIKKYEREELEGEKYKKIETMHERIKEFTFEFGLDLEVAPPIGIYASYYKELDLYVIHDPADDSQSSITMYISKERRIFLTYTWCC